MLNPENLKSVGENAPPEQDGHRTGIALLSREQQELARNPSPLALFAKRSFDICIGLMGTFVFLITYPIIAFLIWIDSPGPSIYRQSRVGINQRRHRSRKTQDTENSVEGKSGNSRRKEDFGGKIFTIYKYRTMRIDAETGGPQLCQKGTDNRVTTIGKWLRALHLDELPQFWNILIGDMSFIGPRPERPHFTRKYKEEIPHYYDRTLYVRPGLTGLAQIILGYDDSLESVVRKSYFDLSYGASLCSIWSWMNMEKWILLNTFLYLAKPANPGGGEVRELKGLQRAKILGFKARSPEKKDTLSAVATVRANNDRNYKPMIVKGSNAENLEQLLHKVDFSRDKKLELCLQPGSEFDLEDLGVLIRLIHKVRRADGSMTIKNAPIRVERILKEIHLDKVVNLERIRTSTPNFFSVDVECWFHADNLKTSAPRSTWHLQPTRVVSNVERILDLLRIHEAKATFFVLGWVADHFPEVVKMIDQEGHEIGTHGYNHHLITEMTPQSFEDDLMQSLDTLSRFTSQKIISHRASNFTIMKSTLWALEILEKHGIRNDSSIFPIFRKRYGIPDYPNRLPHVMVLENGRTINQFPMATLRVGNNRVPIAGGGYLRLYPYRVTDRYIEQMNRRGLPVMSYIHPWELDKNQQRQNVGPIKGFQHYVNLNTTDLKIDQLLSRFRFCSIRDALDSPRIQKLFGRNPIQLQPDQKFERQFTGLKINK